MALALLALFWLPISQLLLKSPRRPTPRLSFAANWTMRIEGQSFSETMPMALDHERKLVSTVAIYPHCEGSQQIIDDFLGNNRTWPFVSHCVARRKAAGSASACFVGPTGTDPGGSGPEVYFMAQTFNMFDNLTLFSSSSFDGADGILTRWRASGQADPGAKSPLQTSVWTFSANGLCHKVDTNYSSKSLGTFERKHIVFEGVVAPAPANAFAIPQGMTCIPYNDSLAMFRACQAAACPRSNGALP